MTQVVLVDQQAEQTRVSSAYRIARAISWICHPLVFVSVSLAVIVWMRLANRVGLSVLLALIIAVVLPIAVLLIRGVRSGRWSDADVSVRAQRVHFYPRAILLSLGGIATLWFLRAPAFIVRGALVTLGLLLLAAVFNRSIKISLHAMFAFYCAVVLFAISGLAGLSALIAALLVAWSRLQLRRHGVVEVLAGTAMGVLGGVAAAWWP